MRAKVTEQGVTIPRQLLEGAEEVEITEQRGVVTVTPIHEGDPITRLGRHPVACGAPDASENHDPYLYGSGG
jgi:hypothetical protein